MFQEFLAATGIAGEHNPCTACTKAKNMLRLVGGDEVRTLFDHVRFIEGTDSWDETLMKISKGIKQQTNQAAARYKLMRKMPQGELCFAEWYPRVKEQAERCTWLGYDADTAARDAILYTRQEVTTEDYGRRLIICQHS